MDPILQSLLPWVIEHGYILLFLAMCIEGPIVTAVAAFAAAQGYFSLPIVFILSIFGDLIPDSLYYFVGYLGRQKLINKMIKKFHISDERMKEIERLAHKHSFKAIVAIKLTPVLPFFGFAVLGSLHTPFKKFMSAVIVVTLCRAILLIIAGYYFGLYLDVINEYIGNFGVIMGMIAVIMILLFMSKLFLQQFTEKK